MVVSVTKIYIHQRDSLPKKKEKVTFSHKFRFRTYISLISAGGTGFSSSGVYVMATFHLCS